MLIDQRGILWEMAGGEIHTGGSGVHAVAWLHYINVCPGPREKQSMPSQTKMRIKIKSKI